jgi:vanillin dehydrogenase
VYAERKNVRIANVRDEKELQTTGQPLLIGGSWTEASAGESFDVLDPYTGELATRAAAASPSDAAAAARAAGAAFDEWAGCAPEQRRETLVRAAELLDERREQIAAMMTAEIGATFGWGMFNCELAAGMLREAATLTRAGGGEVIPSDVPGKLAFTVRAPAGVVVAIAPWNAPLILATRAIAAPLALGNTVVLKASERCPATHAAVARALADAGVPDGAVNLICHRPEDAREVVEQLIAAAATRRVNFTGSTAVGRLIAASAARHLKRVLLELGGKAPLIVLDDADVERAAAAASFGAFMNQGQICMSTERVIVDRGLAEPFGASLAARAAALRVGDPRDPDTQIGPLIDASARERASRLVADARERGARVLAGGQADGACFAPTVLAGVTADMEVYATESFAPLVALIEVDGVEQAVSVANDTEYGLSAAVFGADVGRALAVAARVQSGMCHVNDATVHDEPQMPFGGVKESGWGRFGGRAAIEEFTELRWITLQEHPREYPI